MTSPEETTQRLSREAARWRRRFREAQLVIADQNIQLLENYLRTRLADPSDFQAHVTTDALVDRTGRLLWEVVAASVDELLAAKPHLARRLPWERGRAAVDFFTREPARPAVPGISSEARGQRTTGQRPVRVGIEHTESP